jgi:hypothetical protein
VAKIVTYRGPGSAYKLYPDTRRQVLFPTDVPTRATDAQAEELAKLDLGIEIVDEQAETSSEESASS